MNPDFDLDQVAQLAQAAVASSNSTSQQLAALNQAVDSRFSQFQQDMADRLETLRQLLQASMTAYGPDQARVQPAPVEAAATRSSAFSPPGPKLAKPDKFDGTRSKLDGFLVQIQLNLHASPLSFGADEQKVAYVASFLTGQALQWFTPLISRNDDLLRNYQDFIATLRRRFGDPDEVRKAERKLERMTQGRRSVSAYAAEFLLEAAKTQWDDTSKKSRFRNGLRDDVADLLIRIPKTQLSTLDDFVEQAIACDDRLFERRQDKMHRDRDGPVNNSGSAQQPSAFPLPPRNSYNSGSTSLTKPVSSMNSSNGATPMELGATGHVTEEERKRRFEANLCLYCGEPGHLVRACPTRPRTKKNNQLVNATETEHPNGTSPRADPRA